jgi:hypothetical protein
MEGGVTRAWFAAARCGSKCDMDRQGHLYGRGKEPWSRCLRAVQTV